MYILSKPYKAARGVSYGTIPVIQPRMERVTMGEGERKKTRRSTLTDHSQWFCQQITLDGFGHLLKHQKCHKIEGDGRSLVQVKSVRSLRSDKSF